MTRKSKGNDWEDQVKKDLKSLGYDVVKASASKGNLFGMDADLIGSKIIASKDTSQNKKTAYILIVQCKVKGK